jgi:hypothetical protein
VKSVLHFIRGKSLGQGRTRSPGRVDRRARTLAWLLPLAWLGSAQAAVVVRQVGQDIDVEFKYVDHWTSGVAVAGNFNDWSLSSGQMERLPDGAWRYVLHGVKLSDVLQYKFVVKSTFGSGKSWVLDADAPDTTADGKGGTNGQVVVKQFLRSTGAEEIPGDIVASGARSSASADVPATAAVKPATGSRNLIADASFEGGSLDGWTLRGDTGIASNELAKDNAHSGEHSFKYTSSKPFKLLLLKRFTGLAPGTYSFRAWAAGGGGETVLRLLARDCGGPVMSTTMINTGWQNWKQYTVKGIPVKTGECTIGLYVDAPAATWGNIDDVEFYEDTTWARLTVEPAH